MAVIKATKSGNWSDATVWSPSAPTANDDVYSNTFTVTIDTSPTVLSISNGAATGVTAGGGFTCSANGLTLTCTGSGITGNSANNNVLTFSGASPNIFTVVSSITASASNSNVLFSGSGTLNVTGNVTTTVTGGSNAYGISITSTGTLNLTGAVTCGTATAAYGVWLQAAGCTANITGNVTGNGGPAVFVTSTGTLNVTGSITGGTATAGYGVTNNSTGTFTHIGTAQASATTPAIGPGAVGQVTILSGPLLSTDASAGGAAASGVNPVVALRWFPADNALSTFEYRMRGQTATGSPSARPARQLFLPDAYSATYPSAANVRSGTTYGPGSIYTGTCAVPAAASVLFGVPVDATTGTVTITAADIRSALGLSAANLDTQLSGINTAATNAPTNVPPAVRTNLTAELARLSNAATTAEVSDIVTAAV